ncbi:hypothetical protein [uncultured Algimonas sp.]|uniref:hypothetical protein n=1 Tax=uncultured Algimonas sp. TaxID=1547920 RepID=UPI00262C9BB6|nr:hypothetical protein [uncultured Algimonas sp.]
MAIKKALLGVGGLLALLCPTGAVANPGEACNVAGSPGCDAGLALMPAPVGHGGPGTVENRTPYDFLDSVHFQRLPHVSITRIHGLDATVGLPDAPVAFTSGCYPGSTTYCRSGAAAAPVIKAPAIPQPVIRPPIVAAPTIHRPPVYRPIAAPTCRVVPPAPGPVRWTPCAGTAALAGGRPLPPRPVAQHPVPRALTGRRYGS